MDLPYWRLSGFYFFYFAALGAFLPYWSLYLKHVGFSAIEIGELTGLLVATKIVAPYIWSWLADKSGRFLRLICITSLFSALLFAGFLYRQDYWWVAAVTLCFSFFWNATLPQFEAATLLHVKAQPERYSRIRLWGSVGFIAAVLGFGRLLDYLGIDGLPWIIFSLLAGNWLVALTIPEVQAHDATVHAADSLYKLLFKPELLAFLGVYLLLQVAHGPYYVFYSVYLQQHGYSATSTGFLWALGVFAEILVFVWMFGLLKRAGLRGLLLTSLAFSMLRWLMIAYGAEQLPVIVAAQLLHAFSFGVAHVVAMQLLQIYFGSRHLSKGQAMYSGVSFGLGGMLGSVYSGYLWDDLGGGPVFLLAALACGLAFLLAFVGVGRQKRVGLS